MPHPVYIICCESGAEDRFTGVLSHFNVFEKFLVWKSNEGKAPELPERGMSTTLQRMRVISVWMKSDDDPDDAEFEYSVEVTLPNDEANTTVVNSGKFSFTKPLHRMVINFIGKPNVTRPGVLWLESKVRRIGTDSWISQRYPIIVEFKN